MFDKDEVGQKWSANLGSRQQVEEKFCKQSELALQYRDWTLTERIRVTQDVDHIVLEPPTEHQVRGKKAVMFLMVFGKFNSVDIILLFNLQGFHFFVPVGHHVNLKGEIEDVELVRSYTPVLDGLGPDVTDDGRLHFLIKTYPNGAFTPYLKNVEKGKKKLPI